MAKVEQGKAQDCEQGYLEMVYERTKTKCANGRASYYKIGFGISKRIWQSTIGL